MRFWILLLAVLLELTVASFALAAEPAITLVTEEWPPFNYTENGAIRGFSSEIVDHIMKTLGVRYEIRVLPGVRSRQLLDAGPRVMLFTMLRIPEREGQYKWIGPIGDASFHFYKKKGSPLVIETLADAKKVPKVSCRNVGLVYSFLTNAGFANLDTSANPSGIYLKVVYGRCDLAVGEPSLGVSYWLKQAGIPADALEKTSFSILGAPLFIACSMDIPDAEVARWQDALDKMKASGEYMQLYRKYEQ